MLLVTSTVLSMSANVQAALDAAGKVVKKQKICATKVEQCVDQLLQLVSAAQAQQASGASTAVPQLLAEVERLGLTKEMNTQTKELHATITKLSKVGLLTLRTGMNSTQAGMLICHKCWNCVDAGV